ncbi:uncharacterized protein LOC124273115 isoform X2 [Haliotis rubra]|uniref:uncharacterized protein LOC124273115 isoform X2 n=1 Tax=Haliotis rubra TaxID=36100 RepID=UPI001EE50C38|nr:uncharacterized protein LOC124273115 isoform X2 [Haliotis rubra]
MAKNSDFIDWEDLELADFLGDFRSDHSSSEDEGVEDVEVAAKRKHTCDSEQTGPLFKCPLCVKTYKSQSAADHLQLTVDHGVVLKEDTTKQQTSWLPDDLEQVLREATSVTLTEMENSLYHTMQESAHGYHIVFLAKKISGQSSGVLTEPLSTHLKEIFRDFGKSGFNSSEREAFFKQLHKLKMNFDVLDSVEGDICDSSDLGNSESFVPVFITSFIDGVVSATIRLLLEKCEEDQEKQNSELSQQDQSVLHLIAGFFIYSAKKSAKQDKEKLSAISKLVETSDSKKENFLIDVRKWSHKIDRGGLQQPCDSFFLIVRLFETEARKAVPVLKTGKMGNQSLREAILTNVLVIKYWNSLVGDSHNSSQLLEEIVQRFLKVRSHAMARKLEREASRALKAKRAPRKKSRSLRGSIKD